MTRTMGFLALACVGLGCAGPGCASSRPAPAPCPAEAWPGEARPARAPPAPPHQDEDAASALDDRRAVARLIREGADLVASGRTTPMATLLEQLRTARCRLDLPAAPAETLSGEALYERVRPSVLLVGGIYKCPKCRKWHASTATAFVIAASGACATNYHVVHAPGKETLVVMTADGRVRPVKAVLAASEADDAAILQVDGLNLPPLALSPTAPPGMRVRVLSHPDNRLYTLTEGIVSRHFTAHRPAGDAPVLAITADYARGSSGGPVLNDAGAAVGLVASTQWIYYEGTTNLQMVVKHGVPAASVLRLVEGPAAPAP